MNGRSPKNKGDRYERDLAAWLNTHVFGKAERCHRAPLSGGGRHFLFGGGNADLVGTPKIWVEAKRTERFQPYVAIEQAEKGISGKESPDIPVVVSRRNRMSMDESLVVMRLGDWSRLYSSWLLEHGEITQHVVFEVDDSPTPEASKSQDDMTPDELHHEKT